MKKHQAGFTLVELVTVIIIIGILAVNVLPKFSGSSSFEAYSYRVQLISALRLTQQRAMQQTNSATNYCHQIVFDDEKSRYGVPDRTDCDVIAFPSSWQPDASGLVVEDKHQVSFSISGITNPSRVRFDSMGRPLEDCTGGCVINVIGNDETVMIEIESEGYIHAR
jgi:MSHA pilin protein MshC